MSTIAWRRVLLGLCALGFILTMNAVWTGTRTIGVDPGVGHSATTPFWVVNSASQEPFVLRMNAPPGSAAYAQGLRTGDRLDLRLLTAGDRYRWLSYFRLSGQRLDLPIDRDGKRLTISLVVPPSTILSAGPALSFKWDVWAAYLGFIWSLTFAAVIAWRRSENKEARILSALLATGIVGYCTSAINWITPWPGLDAVVAFVGSIFSGLSAALLATYAMTFAPAPTPLRFHRRSVDGNSRSTAAVVLRPSLAVDRRRLIRSSSGAVRARDDRTGARHRSNATRLGNVRVGR